VGSGVTTPADDRRAALPPWLVWLSNLAMGAGLVLSGWYLVTVLIRRRALLAPERFPEEEEAAADG
jgi:hypothetical protein